MRVERSCLLGIGCHVLHLVTARTLRGVQAPLWTAAAPRAELRAVLVRDAFAADAAADVTEFREVFVVHVVAARDGHASLIRDVGVIEAPGQGREPRVGLSVRVSVRVRVRVRVETIGLGTGSGSGQSDCVRAME